MSSKRDLSRCQQRHPAKAPPRRTTRAALLSFTSFTHVRTLQVKPHIDHSDICHSIIACCSSRNRMWRAQCHKGESHNNYCSRYKLGDERSVRCHASSCTLAWLCARQCNHSPQHYCSLLFDEELTCGLSWTHSSSPKVQTLWHMDLPTSNHKMYMLAWISAPRRPLSSTLRTGYR
jgi:hypothetical protein